MNINGKNGLACLTNMRTLPGTVVLKPLPGLPVIRDLIVDMTQFFKQYHSIKPYLSTTRFRRARAPAVARGARRAQRPVRSASCAPVAPPAAQLLVEPDKFVGPAGLLQAYRFIADSRDQATGERLDNLEDPYRPVPLPHDHELRRRLPQGLNPTKAIGKIKGADGPPGGLKFPMPPQAQSPAPIDAGPAQAALALPRGLLENDLFIETLAGGSRRSGARLPGLAP